MLTGTDPKSTAKPKPNLKTKPYVLRIDGPPEPPPFHNQYDASQQPLLSSYHQQFNIGYYRFSNH